MTVLVQSGRHPDRRRSMRGKCGIRRIRISRNTVCSPQGNAPLPSELYRKAFRVPEFLSKGQQLHCTFWKPVLQFIHSYTIIKWEEKQLFLKRYTNGLSGRVHTKKVSFLTKPQHHKQSRMFGSTCASLCGLNSWWQREKISNNNVAAKSTEEPVPAADAVWKLVQNPKTRLWNSVRASVCVFICSVPLAPRCHIQLLLWLTQLCAVLHQTAPLTGQI